MGYIKLLRYRSAHSMFIMTKFEVW